MTTIDERVTKLENRMDTVEATLAEIAALHKKTDERLDSFIRESSRLFANSGDRLNRIEAAVESLVQSVTYLSRKAEEDRAEFRAQGQRMDGMINRLDALVNYLISNENRGSE